jgi:threonine dehydrogenase-like Zn-dependent dehydrogenase
MSETDARAFWITAPGSGAIRTEAVPTPADGEVLVRTLFTGVSRGTEALVFQGRVPPGEYERLRAPFQGGACPAPVKYGYANVGIVEAGPRPVLHRHVFALVPHQPRYCVPAAAVHVLPPGVPPERAVLAANLETAINGIWDAAPQIGDRVVVIGGGVVGCLVAWLAGRIPGADVTLVDVRQERAAIADALGVAFSVPDFAPADADVVIHASGSPAGLQLALRLAGMESTIRSSQVGQLPPGQRSRWDHGRRMRLALSLLTDASLDVLFTGESPFDDLPSVMPTLAAGAGDVLCHRIRYW